MLPASASARSWLTNEKDSSHAVRQFIRAFSYLTGIRKERPATRRLIVFLLSAILALSACGGGAAVTGEPTALPAVKADTRVIADGHVVPVGSADLSFPTTGIVDEVLVAEGDHVEAGQLLATLGNARQSASLLQAQAEVQRARGPARPGEGRLARAGNRERPGCRRDRAGQARRAECGVDACPDRCGAGERRPGASRARQGEIRAEHLRRCGSEGGHGQRRRESAGGAGRVRSGRRTAGVGREPAGAGAGTAHERIQRRKGARTKARSVGRMPRMSRTRRPSWTAPGPTFRAFRRRRGQPTSQPPRLKSGGRSRSSTCSWPVRRPKRCAHPRPTLPPRKPDWPSRRRRWTRPNCERHLPVPWRPWTQSSASRLGRVLP